MSKRNGKGKTFNSDQEAAIAYFRKALDRLSSVGLRMVGAEDTLCIYKLEQWLDIAQGLEGPIERINDLDHEGIKHTVYVDSGAP